MVLVDEAHCLELIRQNRLDELEMIFTEVRNCNTCKYFHGDGICRYYREPTEEFDRCYRWAGKETE